MSSVVQRFVSDKRSVAQVIENSDCFACWLQNHISTMEGAGKFGTRICNLRAAKHRFESFSKPMARICLYLPAVLQTMHDIAARRDTQSVGKWAKEWLELACPKDFVLLAMLADAADESMALVRFTDNESGASWGR